MTRVDFYLLAERSRLDRFLLACRLVERILAESLTVYIRCPSPELADHLDRLLWTFRDASFLPHGQTGRVDAELTPVLIGTAETAPSARAVLVNLAAEPPVEPQRFARICEPLDHDPEIRAAGRQRYRHYRALGLDLHHNQLEI